MPPVCCEDKGNAIRISGDDFEVVFDKVRGRLASWTHQGASLIATGPQLNFWRATTDNDRGMGGKVADKWRQAGLDKLQHRVDGVRCEALGPNAVRVRIATRVAPPIHTRGWLCEYTYSVYGTGDVVVETHGAPQGEWPETLPRIGLELELPGRLDHVAWYGRGPGESYPDSCQANRVGAYACCVDDLYFPYVFPQENGNRMDVRWVALTNARGCGLLAVGAPTLNFSAHRFSVEDLETARHTCELTPRENITLHLDYRQRGLGTASCGPGPLPQYELPPEEFGFSLRLAPVAADRMSAMALSKRTLRS